MPDVVGGWRGSNLVSKRTGLMVVGRKTDNGERERLCVVCPMKME